MKALFTLACCLSTVSQAATLYTDYNTVLTSSTGGVAMGTIQDNADNSVVANWKVTITGSSTINDPTISSGGVRINSVYDANESLNALVEFTSISADILTYTMTFDSFSGGNFSRPNAIVGVTSDVDAEWVQTNSSYTWTDPTPATVSNGATVLANTQVQTTDYVNATGSPGIWGMVMTDEATVNLGYAEIGGVDNLASDTFIVYFGMTSMVVPEPSSSILIAGSLLLIGFRRSRKQAS